MLETRSNDISRRSLLRKLAVFAGGVVAGRYAAERIYDDVDLNKVDLRRFKIPLKDKTLYKGEELKNYKVENLNHNNAYALQGYKIAMNETNEIPDPGALVQFDRLTDDQKNTVLRISINPEMFNDVGFDYLNLGVGNEYLSFRRDEVIDLLNESSKQEDNNSMHFYFHNQNNVTMHGLNVLKLENAEVASLKDAEVFLFAKNGSILRNSGGEFSEDKDKFTSPLSITLFSKGEINSPVPHFPHSSDV